MVTSFDGMDRRDALRVATALAVGAVGSACDATPGRQTPHTPTSPSAAPSHHAGERPPAAYAEPAGEISHGRRDRNAVALTFHGQGDPVVVGRLLDELAKDGARVTVLAVGTWLAAHPQLAHRILDAGHELGNHTQHHADIAHMTAAQAHAEISECAHALKSVTGSIGRWFRPSQSRHATERVRRAAADVGYRTCLSYDVDSLDYTDPGPAAVVGNTLTSVRAGSVVSLHFGHAGTVTAMAPLLAGLRRRGLTPVTVTELMR
jgi:peptidoglycan/xylan/chitin deacetylase (PgdA/CDA1 family)